MVARHRQKRRASSGSPSTTADSIMPTPGVRRASHTNAYHLPLLLSQPATISSLLTWFGSVSKQRLMPWRKAWLDRKDFSGSSEQFQAAVNARAYEIWVSEIMLQQTRVSVVVPYFETWIQKWPTVQDLAIAEQDEVLSAWKGLGYYSRACRLHDAAKLLVTDQQFKGQIPTSPEKLLAIPGIGKYTAGAISSIAFGQPTPVLDGNVSRVLARQCGICAETKQKRVSKLLWETADTLVKHATEIQDGTGNSSHVPGLWNQALMELGSTVCTPRPKCGACPIQPTCKAFLEGEEFWINVDLSSSKETSDIEDLCSVCDILDLEMIDRAPKQRGKRTTASDKIQSRYFTSQSKKNKSSPGIDSSPSRDKVLLDDIQLYCSLFPKKTPKQQVREEAHVVCLIEYRNSSGSVWFIEKRPGKGLLASLWQFPMVKLGISDSTKSSRNRAARDHVQTDDFGLPTDLAIEHITEVGSIVHILSHLKLTLFVHRFVVEPRKKTYEARRAENFQRGLPIGKKWVNESLMNEENLWIGMKRSWAMVRSSRDVT